MDRVSREGRLILAVLELNNKSVNCQQKMKASNVGDPLYLSGFLLHFKMMPDYMLCMLCKTHVSFALQDIGKRILL